MSPVCSLNNGRMPSSLKTVRPSNFTSPTRYWSPSETGISSVAHFFAFLPLPPPSTYVMFGSPTVAVT